MIKNILFSLDILFWHQGCSSGNTTICFKFFVFIYTGDQVLYYSFDTLDNFTPMQDDNISSHFPLVEGQVRYIL